MGALARRLPDPRSLEPITTLYIPVPSPFSELETFISEAAEAYNLTIFRCVPPAEGDLPVESVATKISGDHTRSNSLSDSNLGAQVRVKTKGEEGMRHALGIYREQFPHIEAILVGTRRGDPHGGESLR